jgi:hypothetical protein
MNNEHDSIAVVDFVSNQNWAYDQDPLASVSWFAYELRFISQYFLRLPPSHPKWHREVAFPQARSDPTICGLRISASGVGTSTCRLVS